MVDVRNELARAGETVRERFAAEKRVLSFPEFLALVSEHPWRHTRDAARYLHDCFEHFGRDARNCAATDDGATNIGAEVEGCVSSRERTLT